MAIPVAIQPFYNASSGPLDLFTGVLYVMRVLTLGHGSIQPSTEDLGILEQNIYSPNPFDNSNLWYFEPASSPGLYLWKSLAFPNATVMWDASEEDTQESPNGAYNNDEEKSFPLILDNLSEDGRGSSEDSPLVSSLWTLQPRNLIEFGLYGTGYSLKSFNPLHKTGSVTLGSESSKGWWLQVDEENDHAKTEDEPDSCSIDDSSCLRSKSNTIILLEPTNFKLHADTNHMDIGEFSDILKQVRVRKEHLSNRVTLYNPSEREQSFNVSLDTIVEYDVFTQPQQEFRMFSSLTIYNPMTNPSMKNFNFEEESSWGEDYNGKDLRLKASSYVKSVDEIDADPFTTKTVSGYVTYIEEFRGIPYASWTNVSAQIPSLKEQGATDDNKPPYRWVKNSDLLKHLVRSRGYHGPIREVETGPGEPAKITIKIRGTIRGKLPLPFIQFEEISTSPYSRDQPSPTKSPTTDESNRPNPSKISVGGEKFTSHLS